MSRMKKINDINNKIEELMSVLDDLILYAKKEEDQDLAIAICDYIANISRENKKLITFLIIKLQKYLESDKIDESFNKLIDPLREELDNE